LKVRLFVNWAIAKRLLCDKNIKLKTSKKLSKQLKEKTQSETKRTSVLLTSANENEQKILKVVECSEEENEAVEKQQRVEKERVGKQRPRVINFRIKNRINFFNCFQVPSSEVGKKQHKHTFMLSKQKKSDPSEESRKSVLMRTFKRYGSHSARRKAQRLKMLTRYGSEELLETSSIIGYKSTINTNKNRVFNEDVYDLHNIFMSSLRINQKSSLI
jgi:hypothetical protein